MAKFISKLFHKKKENQNKKVSTIDDCERAIILSKEFICTV